MKWIILVACLLPGFTSAEIFKCTGSDGGVDYRDSPCVSASEHAEMIAPPPLQGLDKVMAETEGVDERIAEHERRIAEREKQKAGDYAMRRARYGLSLGMKEVEVKRLKHFGFPDDLNSTQTAYGTRDQWVYETNPNNEYEHMYLYFDDGVLTVIQD